MNFVDEFVIPRDEWLRGEGPDKSFLHRVEDGKECCVGIYLKACGVPIRALTGIADAVYLCDDDDEIDFPDDLSWMLDGSDIGDLYSNNDCVDSEYTESRREEDIASLFADNGIKVTFVDSLSTKSVE